MISKMCLLTIFFWYTSFLEVKGRGDGFKMISGNTITNISLAPFVAAIYRKFNGKKCQRAFFDHELTQMTCTGALISSNLVLTAAHCVMPVRQITNATSLPNYFYYEKLCVLINAIKPGDGRKQGALVYDINSVDGFPEFYSKQGDDDKYAKNIGIIELKDHVASPKFININDSRSFQAQENNICEFFGWGASQPGKKAKSKFKYEKLRIQNQNECIGVSRPDKSTGYICAGNNETRFCGGDSGGPLICNGNFVGILSLSNYDCPKNRWVNQKYGLFSSVPKLHDWILTKMKQLWSVPRATTTGAEQLKITRDSYLLIILVATISPVIYA